MPIVNNPTPVSYTHLRAHETVLDLVCRLLLEKKNKKKISPAPIISYNEANGVHDFDKHVVMCDL